MKFFYNNLGIPALIIYFYCMLIDLTSDYKNVYSHNVCLFGGFSYGLLVCDGFLYILLWCDGFLCRFFLLKLFLVWVLRVGFAGMLFEI